ncbi:RNA-binding S4 domain-containing protein [Staphylococcus epidermidis]|uniref:RNA-binding S4 domain-containing protein n=1 Tax=Staphylococcus epidermidis TaxID=1282 RepID=UPI0011A1B801|nr:RNA-binding S4 domain-containing protein [Staphylococcus epidermidis]
MTLHKYLKVSPLLKPPTLPKQITEQPPLTLNPNLPKPPTHIKQNHQLIIPFPQKLLTVKLTPLTHHPTKQNPKPIYHFIKQQPINQHSNP